MPSERRLHPATVLFGLVGQLREFAFPIVAVLVAGSSRGFEGWTALLLVPYSLLAVARYLTFSYAFGETELVIRSGILGRNERHIPYSRIQNLDASQNVFHRMLGVISARLDTGSGSEAEATLSVITRDAYEEIRERVLGTRAAAAAHEAAADAGAVLLRLPTRELVLHGLVDNRGMIVIAGLLGLFFQSGLDEWAFERFGPDGASSRNAIRALFFQASRLAGGASGVLVGVLVILAALVLIRMLSVAIALVRLHGFTLRRVGEDLRAEYGLFTRISSTIPLRRVQTVTITATMMHRWFGRASVRVDTAGGDGNQVQQRGRESLAPIVPAGEVGAVLAAVLPELRLDDVAWKPVAAGAVGRELRQRLVLSALAAGATAFGIGWYALAVFAALALVSWLTAVRYVASLGWATVEGAVLHRSGYVGRHTTIARFTRIQAVSVVQSPFDRRRRMAQVRVDTAGASGSPHRLHIPYLDREDATTLYGQLAGAASRTAFHW